MNSETKIELILGTAGHIDHGKTSLVAALTGTQTDRLPEEKKRGITIELGYAELELAPYHFGIVDVPGHEKFVRQMVSGATGMDVVMLVVAADDSIKPQTREHLDILRFLDLPAGVIVLTKCDLVDPEWLELVEEELRNFVSGSFLQDAAIVRTSAVRTSGLDELKQALQLAADQAHQRRQQELAAPFRMPIDRCFSIEGHGTVVTGSVASGQVQVNDSLEIQPGNHQVRIRSLTNHTRACDQVGRGQRAALNLVGIHHDQIGRGQEVGQRGYLRPTTCCNIELLLLADSRPLKNRATVRFHVGTAEILGHIRFAEQDVLEPGQIEAAQLVLSEPCVAVWGQPFILRSESPVATLGGGRVIDPSAMPLRRGAASHLAPWMRLLGAEDPLDRIDAHARLHTQLTSEFGNWDPADLPRNVGVQNPESYVEQLAGQGRLVSIQLSASSRQWLHQECVEELADLARSKLDRLHDHHPLRWSFPEVDLQNQLRFLADFRYLDAALRHLQSEKTVRWEQGQIGLVNRGPQLSKNDKTAMQNLVSQIRSAGKTPPLTKQLVAAMPKLKNRCLELLDLAAAAGELTKVSAELYFHSETMEHFREQLTQAMAGQGMTVSDIKQHLDISRKYAVPLCEFLDNSGFTRREGDVRYIQPQAGAPAQSS